mmetsp:Transcript_9803/g.21248  ORF Transcript_9803/g.21248 Transcript_9803/m.21248 type:complete len:328 (+) Transcript_9803:347-1330(+)
MWHSVSEVPNVSRAFAATRFTMEDACTPCCPATTTTTTITRITFALATRAIHRKRWNAAIVDPLPWGIKKCASWRWDGNRVFWARGSCKFCCRNSCKFPCPSKRATPACRTIFTTRHRDWITRGSTSNPPCNERPIGVTAGRRRIWTTTTTATTTIIIMWKRKRMTIRTFPARTCPPKFGKPICRCIGCWWTAVRWNPPRGWERSWNRARTFHSLCSNGTRRWGPTWDCGGRSIVTSWPNSFPRPPAGSIIARPFPTPIAPNRTTSPNGHRPRPTKRSRISSPTGCTMDTFVTCPNKIVPPIQQPATVTLSTIRVPGPVMFGNTHTG